MTSITSSHTREVCNVEQFIEELNTASASGCGVVCVKAREGFRAASAVLDWCGSVDYSYKLWSPVTGWMSYSSPQELDDANRNGRLLTLDLDKPKEVDGGTKEITAAFQAIYNAGRHTALTAGNGSQAPTPTHLKTDAEHLNTCYVMLYPSYGFDSALIQQYIRQQLRDGEVSTKRLVIIESPSARIPPAIEAEPGLIFLDFLDPSYLELRMCWDEWYSSIEPGTFAHFSDDDIGIIIQNAMGMTYTEFAMTIAVAYVSIIKKLTEAKRIHNPKEDPVIMPADFASVKPLDFVDYLSKVKTDALKRTDLLELLPASSMDEIGGMDVLKQWVLERKVAFSDEAKAFGIDAPKGFLAVGVPGTGKSLVAKATAGILNIPCVRFDVGRVFGKWVGESEANMRDALSRVESMAPCVLFIDEVDKGFAGSAGASDSGTTSRVLGTILTWMQERNSENSPVFMIMTANNVTGLPPELLRKGRLDEIFSVSFPHVDERKEIVKIHFERRGHKMPETFYEECARATEQMVGAEIESVVKETLLECFRTKVEVNYDVFKKHAESMPIMARTFAKQVGDMDEWAKNNAKAASSTYTNTVESSSARASSKPMMRRSTTLGKRVINKDIGN